MCMCLFFPRMLGDHRAGHVAGHVIHVTLCETTRSTLHFTPKHVQTCLLRHIAIIFTLNPIVRHGYDRCTGDTINQRARTR